MMNLEKLGLSSEDMLQRSQLAKIQGGGDASDYCVSLYVISLCNDLDLDAGTGWQYGWAAGNCVNNGMSSEAYHAQALDDGYAVDQC